MQSTGVKVVTTDAKFNRELIAALPLMRRWALKFTLNAANADDLVQDTCCQALRYRHSYSETGNFQGWLRVMMTRLFTSKVQREKIYSDIPAEDALRNVVAVDNQEAEIELKETIKLIDNLNPNLAHALTRSALGYTLEEINTNTGTARSRVSRARSALRELVE